MTAAINLQRDDVVAALRPSDVIAHFGIAGRAVGHEFRTRLCPACGPRSRDSVTINLTTGGWSDHAHGCKGGLLDLVAGLSGIDIGADFPRVLERAAEIAGVGPDMPPERRTELDARRRAAEEKQRQERDRARHEAVRLAGGIWRGLARSSIVGTSYLRSRGLDPAALLARDLVRFDRAQNPVVALWSSRGEVVNCVTRAIVIPPGLPKVRGLAHCPTAGTLVGRLDQLRAGQTVVIGEGVVDTLAASLAWPDALVLGAHGVSRYAMIAGVVAPRVADLGGELLLVAHNDPERTDPSTGEILPGVGQEAASQAMVLAIAAGLVSAITADDLLHGDVRLVDLGGAKDLAEAWQAGWRP